MIDETETQCYRDWRRSESYAIPATQEGVDMAEERYKQFKKGWYYGMRRAIFLVEQEHKENKHIHKFYLFLAEKLRSML